MTVDFGDPSSVRSTQLCDGKMTLTHLPIGKMWESHRRNRTTNTPTFIIATCWCRNWSSIDRQRRKTPMHKTSVEEESVYALLPSFGCCVSFGSVFEGVGVMVGWGVDRKVADCYAYDKSVEDVLVWALLFSFRLLCAWNTFFEEVDRSVVWKIVVLNVFKKTVVFVIGVLRFWMDEIDDKSLYYNNGNAVIYWISRKSG